MPISIPTRTIGSLGPKKSDLVPQPNPNNYVGASEWECAMDQIIALSEVVKKLEATTFALGDLGEAYKRGTKLPSVIQLDRTRGGLYLQDDIPSIGRELLTAATGTSLLFSVAPDKWVVSTASGLGLGSDLGGGAIQLLRAGDGFLPATAGGNHLGSVALPFSASYALQHGTRPVLLNQTPKGEIVIDAAQGSMQICQLTGDVTNLSLLGSAPGQFVALFVSQAGPTSYKFTGTLGSFGSTIYSLDGSQILPIAPVVGGFQAISLYLFYCTGVGIAFEVGRWLQVDPESGVDIYDAAIKPLTVDVLRYTAKRTLLISGKNGSPGYVNLTRRGMKPGTRYEIIFGSGKGGAGGLITSAAAPFEIRDNGTALITYNAARTLTGIMTATYDDGGWKLGDATVY